MAGLFTFAWGLTLSLPAAESLVPLLMGVGSSPVVLGESGSKITAHSTGSLWSLAGGSVVVQATTAVTYLAIGWIVTQG